jgi:hypothetical protein
VTGSVSFDRSAAAFADLQRSAPVVARLEATLDVDVEPLSAYAALADESDYGFLLESAEKTPSSDPDGAFDPDGAGDRHARYSFVGYDPDAVVSVWPQETTVEDLGGSAAKYVTPNGGDALDTLREALPDLPRVGFPPRERQQLDGGPAVWVDGAGGVAHALCEAGDLGLRLALRPERRQQRADLCLRRSLEDEAGRLPCLLDREVLPVGYASDVLLHW